MALWKSTGIDFPGTGRKINISDHQIFENMARGGAGCVTFLWVG